MPSLRKGDRNVHGGYAYVSIDDYYETAAKVVVDNGLTWKIRETAFEVIEVHGNRGLTNAVTTTYEVDLMHEGGESMPGFFRATVTHPLQGAQTAGSSMSYVDKLFLRTTFHIVTGEKDADATDTAALGDGPVASGRGSPRGASKAKGVAAGAEQDPFAGLGDVVPHAGAAEPAAVTTVAGGFYDLAGAFVDLAKSEAELTQYWNDNEAAFNSLKGEDEASYRKLIAAFKARKAQLQGAQA